MEKLGIGRPSTFASIVDTLYRRKYVVQAKGKLQSTELGRVVCDFLLQNFHEVFDVVFTARMEDQLDNIASGEAHWPVVMGEMWIPLADQVAKADGSRGRQTQNPGSARLPRKGRPVARKGKRSPQGKTQASAQLIGRNCTRCGQPLVERKSKYGTFVGCSGFPRCRYKEPVTTT